MLILVPDCITNIMKKTYMIFDENIDLENLPISMTVTPI